jgi:hypothetical protein
MALEIHLPELIGERMLETPPGAVLGWVASNRPWRRKIAVIVLGLGTPSWPKLKSRVCSLRPPQAGC